MLQPKTRSALEALCINALRATPTYVDAKAVEIRELDAPAGLPNWEVFAAYPKPSLDKIRIGEAEVATAELRKRYRLVR